MCVNPIYVVFFECHVIVTNLVRDQELDRTGSRRKWIWQWCWHWNCETIWSQGFVQRPDWTVNYLDADTQISLSRWWQHHATVASLQSLSSFSAVSQMMLDYFPVFVDSYLILLAFLQFFLADHFWDDYPQILQIMFQIINKYGDLDYATNIRNTQSLSIVLWMRDCYKYHMNWM
jgi:hypothetical protein